MSTKDKLLKKIKDRSARIGVIGLGYVGLPLVREFVKAGFPATGFDVDEEKVKLLKAGKSYIKHIPASEIRGLLKAKDPAAPKQRLEPTSDFSFLRKMDCIIICVPTPLNEYREPDLSYVFNTTRAIADNLRKGQLIVLESTTYPGTTDEDMRAILEETGLKAGRDFFLAFSPEREDPNNPDFSTSTIPKVVGAIRRTA
jgi:UDP-N-acetyl-D-glucosamine dehydrogenase